MRGLLVCALVLTLGLVKADSATNARIRGSLDRVELRLSKAAAQLSSLKTRMDNGADKRREVIQQQAHIEDRLDKLEGGHCHPGQFYCGEGDNKCIGGSQVCDEVKDCPHNQDEEHCEVLAPSGAVYEATIYERNQCTTRHINSLKISVLSVERPTWFPSGAHYRFAVEIDHSDGSARRKTTLYSKGYYCFARRAFVVLPPEADRLGIICNFHGNNGEAAYCSVLREATLERCLHFRAKRVR